MFSVFKEFKEEINNSFSNFLKGRENTKENLVHMNGNYFLTLMC